MNNALTKITARAKQLQRVHPKTKWTDLIKRASRELKSEGKIGKVTTVRKKTTTKRTTVSGFGKKKSKGSNLIEQRVNAGLTVSAAKHFIKQDLDQKIKKQLYIREFGANKTIKKNARKEISALKSQLRKYL